MGKKAIISISATPEHAKKIEQMKQERLKAGYPKVGTVLRAVKTGFTEKRYDDGHLTKGRDYVVIDNIDLTEGYYHVQSDQEWFNVRLTPEVLKEFFGIEF